ncbi:cell division protein FtsQ [Paraburkholderia sp. D15]|uniref:alginate O-acetyltransferase AlgX-related protein n=1 Tax=Paraburkholderia sp. D15 TaxID=2880218 RepID=UPI002478CC0F|nr:cell division protein FtsQ [Paraburkholderia sp. D15]WGS51249.1 cell division protein FtsQ [Paraburkholderia sp. D15]
MSESVGQRAARATGTEGGQGGSGAASAAGTGANTNTSASAASAKTAGSTTASRPAPAADAPSLLRAHTRVAWLVGLLLALGFGGALTSLVVQTRDGASFDAHGWRDGSLGHSLDRAIDVPYAPALHRWQAAVRYTLFGDLGHQVREGCPGWLFYADGLSAPVQPGHDPVERADGGDVLTDARIATLRRYATALRGMGIQLVVATVPDKARVQSDRLCGLRQDARMTQRLTVWNRALDANHVAHVDLLPALQAARPSFFRTDVHWNARGAQAAAQVVGAAVLPLLDSGKPGKPGDTKFTHTTAAPAPRIGDLLTLANLDRVPDGLRPAPDVVAAETLQAQRSGGLLDDGPSADVLLAGSSFSRRSAFAERLGEQLGGEVWNVSLDDGQFDRALAAVWRDRATWPKSVRVVVWEMSEDALSMPLDAAATAAQGAQGAVTNPAAGVPTSTESGAGASVGVNTNTNTNKAAAAPAASTTARQD